MPVAYVVKPLLSILPKHPPLPRPTLGEFSRYELAILGAPCADIQALVARLLPHLAPALPVVFVDADHAAPVPLALPVSETGLAAALTDKISYRQLNLARPLDRFSQPELLASYGLVLVNGNHFRARQQIAVLDPRKPLNQKLDRLTDVRLLLLPDGTTELPPYLQAHFAGSPPPVLPLADTAAIAAFIRGWHRAAAPPLRGLVLAGGHSQRMQTDKGHLHYHGPADQRQHTAALLAEVCTDVRLSCRPDQAADVADAGLVPLPDTFLGLGPLGGLLSAFQTDPNAAWLVAACDLPFLSAATLRFLVENRQPGRLAMALQLPGNEFPEPLLTIWEPTAYAHLLRFLSLGYACPRKALINSNAAVLPAPFPNDLRNVNTPLERVAAEAELRGIER